MSNIYLRHPRHGEKIAISWMEAREDMEQGWEEFDPSNPDDLEPPASADVATSGNSQHNALRTRRRRKE